VFGVLPGDLRDGQLGGCGDRPNALVVTPLARPADSEVTRALTRLEFDACVLFQTEASRLKNRRNGRAHDIVGIDGEFGMAAGKN